MSETFHLRLKLLEIARGDRGKVEETKNRAPWIAKLWDATDSPELYHLNDPNYQGRPPYCAAGLCYAMREWLRIPDVLRALNLTPEQAEKWRCKSAGAFAWMNWAAKHGLQILPAHCILHAGDIVVYTYSHIELVTDDDNTTTGPFVALGHNTNASGSADGEGCFEKPRSRGLVKAFIRIMP